MLVDRGRIWVKAGDGGNGSASFRREKFVPRGGPDGGDGGRGGSVYLRSKPNMTSLLPYQYTTRFKAENGGSGGKQQRHGKNGKDLYVDVPPGTLVWDDESGELLADLDGAGTKPLLPHAPAEGDWETSTSRRRRGKRHGWPSSASRARNGGFGSSCG